MSRKYDDDIRTKTYITSAWIGSDIIADAIADTSRMLDVVFSEQQNATEIQSCIFFLRIYFSKISFTSLHYMFDYTIESRLVLLML